MSRMKRAQASQESQNETNSSSIGTPSRIVSLFFVHIVCVCVGQHFHFTICRNLWVFQF